MAEKIVAIIGGASIDPEVKKFFLEFDINIEHYNARKSADLKKQTIPKNTLGCIITVDRSHMVFGNSNEIVRHLKSNGIPVVFSSGNFATFNSAKILIHKLIEKYPDQVKEKVKQPESELRLETVKKEWSETEKKFYLMIDEWFEICEKWSASLNDWNKVLENWKLNLSEWKEVSNGDKNKLIKKDLKKNLTYLVSWKEDIHKYGIFIESKINTIKEWKNDVDEYFNSIMEKYNKQKQVINNITDLNSKSKKADLREWKINFNKLHDDIFMLEKEYREWEVSFPDCFQDLAEWEKAVKLWSSNFQRKIQEYEKNI